MTPKEAAAALDGNEYREEGSRELFAAMKAAGLVAVFGASDDLVEFEGAIYDEAGAWGGALLRISASGEVGAVDKGLENLTALWCEEPPLSWTYRTAIPHETFTIVEDGEPYCRGIVFRLSDVVAA